MKTSIKPLGSRNVPAGGWSAKLVIFWYCVRVACILRQQREHARLSLEEAAQLARIEPHLLWRYEHNLESPPFRLIDTLLTMYQAEESAILFFCTFPAPAPSLWKWLHLSWRRIWFSLKQELSLK